MHLRSLPRAVLTLGCATLALAHTTTQDFEDHAGSSAPQTMSITVDESGKANPWTHLKFHNNPSAFQFAIVSDRNGGRRAGIFGQAVDKLNLLQPEFVMSVGDFVAGYSSDPAEINAMWDDFQRVIRKLQMPFFYVPGNHDQSNPVMARIWEERLGRSYYSFVYRNVLFLCLNSQTPTMHHISAEEIAWVQKTLAAHQHVRWTMVFLHTPFWEYQDSAKRGWDEIEAALQGRDYTVFSGHYHTYMKRERHGARYYTFSTTGGGNSLRGLTYGEFDHVAWVTMTPRGPVVANLLLEGVQPDDVRTPESASLVAALSEHAFTSGVMWITAKDTATQAVTLQSANPTDLPVTVTFDLAATQTGTTAHLAPEPGTTNEGRYTFTLQPKSTRSFDLQLSGNPPPADFRARCAARLNWNATLESTQLPRPLDLQDSLVVPVVPRLRLPAIGQAPKIDGNASDWSDVPIYDVADRPFLRSNREGWSGASDCTFRVGYAHDDTYLYVMADVKDDQLVSAPSQAPWMQDGVELRLDLRSPAQQRVSRVWDDGLFFLGACPAPGDGLDPAYVMNHKWLPAGTKVCCRQHPGGYTFEAAIPLDELAKRFGHDWKTAGLRVNLAVNDRDADGRQAQLWWQPDWRTADNVPASGTLFFE